MGTTQFVQKSNVHYGNNQNYHIITVHHNGKKFDYKLLGDKDDWEHWDDDDKQIKYDNLRSAISKQFHLFCQYTLYEDVDGDQCEAEDMDEIIELFGDDDEGKRTLDLIVKVDPP